MSEFRAHLSRYLRAVRRGGEVQLLDNGQPVARLVGLAPPAPAPDEERERLVRAGALRAGTGDAAFLLHAPPPDGGPELSGALQEERYDRV